MADGIRAWQQERQREIASSDAKTPFGSRALGDCRTAAERGDVEAMRQILLETICCNHDVCFEFKVAAP